MAEKAVAPQQPVISVRISDALRARLERLKELLSLKNGESVSTSEVAKQLLESAREDRLEVAELLSDATKSLAQARRKIEAGYSLSRSEWIVVAYFAQQGTERYSNLAPTYPVSGETVKGILEAFLAAYKIRRPSKTVDDGKYLGNLPILNEEGEEVLNRKGLVVSAVVERLIQRVSEPDFYQWPQFAARNLYELLEEEHFPNIEALNSALKPSWAALWRAAARGHYITRQMPVRDQAGEDTLGRRYSAAISSVFEGGFVVSFAAGSGDLSLLLNLPPDRMAMYEMAPYPMIAEFRTLLEEWNATIANSHWKGRYFFVYTVAGGEAEPHVWVRCEGAATFGFSQAEWASIQECFRRAWEIPELQRIWTELSLEYGEL